MSEYSKFRNLDSFQCNVCRYLDRFKCACLEKPYCELEIERAYQQGRADALTEIITHISACENEAYANCEPIIGSVLMAMRIKAEQLKEQSK